MPKLEPEWLEELIRLMARPGGSEIETNEIANLLYGTKNPVKHPRTANLNPMKEDNGGIES